MAEQLQRLYLDLSHNRSSEYQQFMNGTMELSQIRPGLSCRTDNAEVTTAFREVSRSNSRELMLQFRLKSPSLVRYPEQSRFTRLAPHFALIVIPPGESKTETFEIGQRDTVVTLHCAEQFLQQAFRNTTQQLPAWYTRFIAGENVNLHQVLMLTPAMRETAAEIISANHQQPLPQLFLEAKCLSLAWLAFRSLLNDDNSESPVSSLSRGDCDKIEQAKTQMDECFPDMPSLASIARTIGFSDWKLNHGFKSMYGMTPSEYFLSSRMEKAQQLLTNTQLTVTAIALEVGYEFPSNFSKAFKQYAGLSPRDFRGGRLLAKP